MKIPQITSIDTALAIYYKNLELGNADINMLFGKRSSATIARMKKAVKLEMDKMNMNAYSSNKVNTKIAFQTWGLDVEDLEKRKLKIEALNL